MMSRDKNRKDRIGFLVLVTSFIFFISAVTCARAHSQLFGPLSFYRIVDLTGPFHSIRGKTQQLSDGNNPLTSTHGCTHKKLNDNFY